MKKIYTTGVFDLLHRGHINILTQAAALGDLTVGIMSDEGVEKTKGRRPILSLEEREAQIKSLPFVSSVISYSDPDQRTQYDTILPDVIVQGDDWLHSADRSHALAYFKEKNIRLVLLPRTEGISTTEIRKRVERCKRRDEQFLLERVRMVPIEKLRLYEEYDEEKVLRLIEKISREGVFTNPISIVREMIVIDGNNRLEALRRLKATRVPCVIYDYKDIDLVGNVHFIQEDKKTRLSEFAPEKGERIEFPARTPEEIFKLVEEGKMIPNGETFHRVPVSVIRLPIPLRVLQALSDYSTPASAFVEDAIQKGKIRFFQSGVYVCDEW